MSSRYDVKGLRAAASLGLLNLEEARQAVVRLATLLKQTEEAVGQAYGTALVEANSATTVHEEARWRALADSVATHLAEQRASAEGLATTEIIDRVRGARRDPDT